MLIPLAEATSETAGGKAGTLGALSRAGLPVPDGFAVTIDAYRAAVQDRLAVAALPESLLGPLRARLRTLGDRPLAVRSSATDEDTPAMSAAGQHETFLAVRGIDEVAAAVNACWNSLHSPGAVAYRAGSAGAATSEEPAMGVLIQHLVDAEAAGVMFTPAGPSDVTTIEASWGLGPSVVGGTVTPDTFRIALDGAIDPVIADKRTRIDRDGTRLVTDDVTEEDRLRPVLDDATARRLAGAGRDIADLLGGPQDIEWALTGDRLWILQARPVTVVPPERLTTASALEAGTPGSHGTATGTARIVDGPDDFSRVRPGDILVCRHTTPAWTPLLRMVAAVVTETGGALSHAAIVARELGVPAVLGVANATRRLTDGETLTVDGTTGAITQHV